MYPMTISSRSNVQPPFKRRVAQAMTLKPPPVLSVSASSLISSEMHWFSRTFALAFFFLAFILYVVHADEIRHDYALRDGHLEAFEAVLTPQKVVDIASTTSSSSEQPSSTASSAGGSSGGSHSGSIIGGLIIGGIAAVSFAFAIGTIIRRRRRRVLLGDNASELSIAEAQPQTRASLIQETVAAVPDLAFPPYTYDNTSPSRPFLLRSESGLTLIAHPLYTTSMTPDASTPVLSRANSAGTLGPLVPHSLYTTVFSDPSSFAPSIAPSRETSAGTLAPAPQPLYPLIMPDSAFTSRPPSISRPALSRENSAISRSSSPEQIYFSPKRATRPPLSRENTNLSVHEEEDHA
ncbi:hypothetical protein CONPUDRAFT_167699 [Coniophora puteana RWD-64-598 SS2]|uniref:Transmembrane protein n=1 Tax=Coniophora puteana (strain RWD-64-598) TaxID=741705 RepID=A0A5M3ME10_CONPW|nr:uncharacterized protein CONPUDRAFT_167699 [Coniophora puteana RWD-64-598 SS2]EIW77509.1 hypothetical protein CONPUDRAFT_167699 [Coniophora puteana RWD-64-598 SS2]